MGIGYVVGPTLKDSTVPWPKDWESNITVRVCNHPLWESVLLLPGPMREHGEEAVRCERCHAPRCGDAREEDPCMKPRSHTTHHLTFNRQIAPVDGILCTLPGCDCVAKAQRALLHQQ